MANQIDGAFQVKYSAPGHKYEGTKAAIEALTVTEGASAYATDTNLEGFYNGTVWVWASTGGGHEILSATHTDSTGSSVVRGDLITGQGASAKWDNLAISIPAGVALENVLGIINGETEPTWKALFDATTPANLASAAVAGTATTAAHRDHVHSDAAYSLIDGTRPFTGTVGGVTPVASSDLATKEYVDQSVSFIANFYFNNTADALGGIYYKMLEAATGEAESSFSSAALAVGNDQALFNFITPAGVPGVDTLAAGVYSAHIHASSVTAGGRDVKIYFTIVTSDAAGGTQVTRATSEISGKITTKGDLDLHATLVSDVDIAVTDRIIIKWFANISGGGNNPVVNLFAEGTTSAHLSIPTSVEILKSVFVRLDGTNLTDNTIGDASTTKHGFLLKATAPAAGIRNVVAIDNAEIVYKNTALFDTTAPTDLAGTATAGTSLIAARRDHVHLGLASADVTEAVVFFNGGAGTHTAMDAHIASTANPHAVTAAQVAAIPNDGWIAISATGTSGTLDAPSFEISFNADMTALIGLGDRIKITQTTTKYFMVTKIGAYSGGATIITCYGGTDYALVATATTAITAPYVSHVKVPFGFLPVTPVKWSVSLLDTSNATQATPTSNTVYNLGGLSIVAPIGVWRTSVFLNLETIVTPSVLRTVNMTGGLSTSASAFSDPELMGQFVFPGPAAAIGIRFPVVLEKVLSITTKTTYYLVARVTIPTDPTTSLSFRGDIINTKARFECVYL